MAPADLLRPHVAAIAARAAALDEDAAFPAEDVALLQSLGLPAAPLPAALGGQGAGTEPAGEAEITGLLRVLGQANPSLGRLFEAHVNVLRLVARFGTQVQQAETAAIAQSGQLFGLWVTDAPRHPLRVDHGVMQGAKGPCSGAGHLRHALVTVAVEDSTHMALITLGGREHVTPLGTRLLGMRAAANGTIRLDGFPLPPEALLGGPGDYLREPDFSAGAWRTMAVTVGALDALVDAVRTQLRARGHESAPLQQARFGELLIARGTAALWTEHAANAAEGGTQTAPDVVATVNLARVAMELAAFDAMRHAQRALGLAAMLRPNPAERLLRDIATYLRQPAPDAVLTEAAQHAFAQP